MVRVEGTITIPRDTPHQDCGSLLIITAAQAHLHPTLTIAATATTRQTKKWLKK